MDVEMRALSSMIIVLLRERMPYRMSKHPWSFVHTQLQYMHEPVRVHKKRDRFRYDWSETDIRGDDDVVEGPKNVVCGYNLNASCKSACDGITKITVKKNRVE